MRIARPVGRWVLRGFLVLLVALLSVGLWAQFSPRPGVFVINWLFSLTDTGEVKGMSATGVTGRTDLAYGTGKNETFDVWSPEDQTKPLPAIVWVHGGAWIGGDKSQPAPYLRLLAQHGYVGIGINYSLAPDHHYPLPLRQLGDALRYVQENADELGVDPDRIVLAGDSAGSQIAAQYAAVVTNPKYASEVGIESALEPAQLRGTLLHCGPYDPPMVMNAGGAGGWFVRTVGWAYLGTKDFTDPRVKQASIVDHATAAYPPTLLSGGDDDPLTEQGRAFAKRLKDLGVTHEPYFFPGLGHEFQFDLTRPQSREVLDASIEFLGRLGQM
ncbi:alpha/beta hydrolase fold domain-containing protein [Aeromicrobium sp. 636]|uniref:Alpha/beta hydrolase n=1 Tax=Aeromicrobium senzhongii TaxID=2663859 RepID=A0A8I0EXE2_9ACTN|nr:alpha/beta hydrolase [Aeromicrobium sp. 636]MBC9226850.1 alpha/beta hydrolase [Aeromicrobium senzhongii]MCQ3998950.1 alpha/beta hydrolase fold domain-containing protein [Aeromicrobium sp. 636]